MIEIVVARYKEDINWISHLDSSKFRVTVYNKFDGENLLENVGRESHTYLTHIHRRYDSLADCTVFVQGNPFDHAPNFLSELDHLNVTTPDFMFFGMSSPNVIHCDVNGLPHGRFEGRYLPVGAHYEWMTLSKSPQVFIAVPGGQFALSKRNVMRHTRLFYDRAIKTVAYSVNPIEGHCFEREWGMLFGLKSDMTHRNLMYKSDEDLSLEGYLSSASDGNELKCIGKLGEYSHHGY